ncbi:hypothetical protein LTR86_011250, partial [Recurvomyces mirabilis]
MPQSHERYRTSPGPLYDVQYEEYYKGISTLDHSAYLFLQRVLDQLSRELYGPDCIHQSLHYIRQVLDSYEDLLNSWCMLPTNERLMGLPVNHVLDANLRLKYW